MCDIETLVALPTSPYHHQDFLYLPGTNGLTKFVFFLTLIGKFSILLRLMDE